MKKLRIIIGLLCVLCVFGLDTQMISAESTGDVAINAQNFPDEKFLEQIRDFSYVDKNCDDILSPEEIRDKTEITIYTDDYVEREWDITGIEYLWNLESVYFKGAGGIKGTLRNNKKLSEVVLDMKEGKLSQQEIQRIVPLNQIKTLRIENADIDQISLSAAKNLESLTITNCSNLKKLDMRGAGNLKELFVQKCTSLSNLTVSGNKHLECLTLDNTSVKNLNLTKNTKLKTVSVQSGFSCVWTDLITGEKETIPFFREIKNSCKIQFPKKNKITELNYFTMDKELDISKCKKLKKIYVSKNTKLKTDSKWYKRNRKKLAVYAEGFRQKKLKVQNKKKSILLKAMKVKEEDHVYYCEETDGVQYYYN